MPTKSSSYETKYSKGSLVGFGFMSLLLQIESAEDENERNKRARFSDNTLVEFLVVSRLPDEDCWLLDNKEVVTPTYNDLLHGNALIVDTSPRILTASKARRENPRLPLTPWNPVRFFVVLFMDKTVLVRKNDVWAASESPWGE